MDPELDYHSVLPGNSSARLSGSCHCRTFRIVALPLVLSGAAGGLVLPTRRRSETSRYHRRHHHRDLRSARTGPELTSKDVHPGDLHREWPDRAWLLLDLHRCRPGEIYDCGTKILEMGIENCLVEIGIKVYTETSWNGSMFASSRFASRLARGLM